jgi:hypothetical protein
MNRWWHSLANFVRDTSRGLRATPSKVEAVPSWPKSFCLAGGWPRAEGWAVLETFGHSLQTRYRTLF